MLGILLNDTSYEQDIRELMMAFLMVSVLMAWILLI